MKRFIYLSVLNFFKLITRLSWVWSSCNKNASTGDYSICIVTYCKRFDKNFKPLIRQLTCLYPNSEIIVGVNGYYDQEKQSEYLSRFRSFIAAYPNVKWFSYDLGQSLSKMWNQCMLRSSSPWMLVLNDDVIVTKKFRKLADQICLKENTIHVLNMSWSHFFISEQILSEVGWFDERFPGVGNEDWDYEIRALMQGMRIESIRTWGIINLEVFTRDFSWSPQEAVVNEKYSNSNWEFFNQKWAVSKTQKEGYLKTRFQAIPFVRLNPEMETPVFYQLQQEKVEELSDQ